MLSKAGIRKKYKKRMGGWGEVEVGGFKPSAHYGFKGTKHNQKPVINKPIQMTKKVFLF